jgi:nitrite reductase (NADH) small subunit
LPDGGAMTEAPSKAPLSPLSAFTLWRRRRAARAALQSGDPWVCPYCREFHPAFDVGGTKFGFGYPSARFRCCGRAAFLLKDPKTQQLMRFVRIGDGQTDWLPKEEYFAWVAEQGKARGHRKASPHLEVVRKGVVQDLASVRPRKADSAPPAAAAPVGGAAPDPAPPAPAVEFVAVAKVAEVPQDKGLVVQAKGQRIALFQVGGQVKAIADACAHAGQSLGGSVLEDGVVTCNGHGWRYDVASGACENRPDKAVRSFPVKVEDGQVLVAV